MAPYYRNALHRLKRDYQSTVDINKLQIDVAYTQRKGPNTCSYLTALARAKEEMIFDIRESDSFHMINIFILNFNLTCNTNIHTTIIYRIGTKAQSL